jgi:type VI secretion system protein ImpE
MVAAPESPEALLAAGDPGSALKALQQQIRSRPADAKLRTFLFQLMCVLDQWQRAHDQLKVCGELDAGTLAMVNTYSAALQCEAVREAVFAGRNLPHVFGPPTAWVALLAQALQLESQGHAEQAAALRAQAFDQAPASPGQADGQAFAWLADADSRLGPVLEIIINGRYGWLPLVHVRRIDIEPVVDLRDLVWVPVHIQFINGGETVALMPSRYAGSGATGDTALQMGRKTEWLPLGAEQFRGLGQRVLTTEAGDLGLLQVRQIVLDEVAAEATAS